MKIVKRILFIIGLMLISIGILVIGNGYDMYKDALD